jgi:hypothetical protein
MLPTTRTSKKQTRERNVYGVTRSGVALTSETIIDVVESVTDDEAFGGSNQCRFPTIDKFSNCDYEIGVRSSNLFGRHFVVLRDFVGGIRKILHQPLTANRQAAVLPGTRSIANPRAPRQTPRQH